MAKTRFLIIIGIVATITILAFSTSGMSTPLYSHISECYYTDGNNIPHPCMIIDGWYDVLLQSTTQTIDEPCDPKYMVVGNNECVLNPLFIEPNTVIIYDKFENNRNRLAIAPHTMIINMTGNDTVKFVNNSTTDVNIFDNSKGLWKFENVSTSSQRILFINNTDYYQFLIQNSRHGQTGEIVTLSEETNSLPVEIRAKMAQSIIGNDIRTRTEVTSIGSGGAEPGITIGIMDKFENKYENSEAFFYEKYKKMIPFDVPIRVEFRAPITLQTG